MNMVLSARRDSLKTQLRKLRSNSAARVQEYINEAEHQDGSAYWDQFDDLDDLLADFDIYATCADESERAERDESH